MCKAHCLKAGGCADPAHKVSQSTTAPSMVAVPPPPTPIFLVHTTPIVVPLSIPAAFIEPNPPESQSQGPLIVPVPPPSAPAFPVCTTPIVVLLLIPASLIKPNPSESWFSPPVASSSCVPRNARTEPTFAPHMTEPYIAQMAHEEQMREDRHQVEATRLESKWKVQQTAFVYAWMEVCLCKLYIYKSLNDFFRMVLPQFLSRSKKALFGLISS